MFRRQTRGFAFGIPRGIQILPRGNFFQISPKAFPQSVRLGFSRGARISPKGPLWKNLGKPAVRSVHSKSQIAPIGNQSLSGSREDSRELTPEDPQVPRWLGFPPARTSSNLHRMCTVPCKFGLESSSSLRPHPNRDAPSKNIV